MNISKIKEKPKKVMEWYMGFNTTSPGIFSEPKYKVLNEPLKK